MQTINTPKKVAQRPTKLNRRHRWVSALRRASVRGDSVLLKLIEEARTSDMDDIGSANECQRACQVHFDHLGTARHRGEWNQRSECTRRSKVEVNELGCVFKFNDCGVQSFLKCFPCNLMILELKFMSSTSWQITNPPLWCVWNLWSGTTLMLAYIGKWDD